MQMTSGEFESLGFGTSTCTFAIQKDSLPFIKGIPDDKLMGIIGQSSSQPSISFGTSSSSHPKGTVLVFRYDYKDAQRGFPYNVDEYLLYEITTSSQLYSIVGPYLPHIGHWRSELPQGLN